MFDGGAVCVGVYDDTGNLRGGIYNVPASTGGPNCTNGSRERDTRPAARASLTAVSGLDEFGVELLDQWFD